MNVMVISTCELLEVDRFGHLGLFHFKLEADNECTKFSNQGDEDAALRCAQVCSIMGLGFGLAILVFGGFKQFLCEIPCTGIILTSPVLAYSLACHWCGLCTATMLVRSWIAIGLEAPCGYS
jgi:hypothetical protein